MFCSECGQQARGKFCSHCGSPVDGTCQNEAVAENALYVADWTNEVRHDLIVRVPEVRAEIDRHARLAKKSISGEQFLEICEKIVPGGLPLAKLASVIQPLYSSWGINTGKQRTAEFYEPVGRIIVRVLCSLAKHGQTIRKIQQASDGCAFEAVLPSDIWSLEGDLLVTIHRHGTKSIVEAVTKIPGQWMDWGKSNRCLDQLLGDLGHRAAA